MKNQRNKPCWCGSGKKYKRCHYRSSESARITRPEIANMIIKSKRFRKCLCPEPYRFECSGEIIKAHSLSRMASLSLIAEDHHVLSYGYNTNKLIFGDSYAFDKVSLKQASVFTGFCGHHDRNFFAPLDKEEFDGSLAKTALIAYRTACRETYAKQNTLNLFEEAYRSDVGRKLSEQIAFQAMRQSFIENSTAGLKDLEIYKISFEAIIDGQKCTNLRYLNLEFAGDPPIAASGLFTVHHDLALREVQDMSNGSAQWELLCLTILPHQGKTKVSLCWLEELSVSVKKFIASIFETEFNLGTIVWACLLHVENTFFRPSFIDTLDSEDRSMIEHCAMFGMTHMDIKLSKIARSRLEALLTAKPTIITSKML